ncbi:MAG: cardiolipin synthase B [Gammaproteobacteria bacterium]|nr:cardiolipin synthase B [Gammaproteobacteria bacterium]
MLPPGVDDLHPCQAKLLVDGPQTYAAMKEAILNARHYVYMQTYAFGDAHAPRELAQCLVLKAGEHIPVYLQIDAFGSLETDDSLFETLREAGVVVQVFNELSRFEASSGRTINSRNHRKILVVDSREAFTGGINVSGRYGESSNAPQTENSVESGWRDTHMWLKGYAAKQLAETFETSWDGDNAPSLSRVIAAAKVTDAQHRVAIRHAVGGNDNWSDIRKFYLIAIRNARTKIWITQAYFAPDKVFVRDLCDASKRGIDVRIILPGYSDIDIVVASSRARYGRLLKAGARLFEMRGSVLHAKTAVIDSAWSTVGSSNLDYRSFLHNFETNAFVVGSEFARALEQQFLQDQERADEIDAKRWAKRPCLMMFKEFVATLLDYRL